ncbi:hypothetical protein TCAL_02568 [Tigriopus californicus]|uniref:MORN repeat-containing protein 3 n=1 Tax=Tigriopus californicus TaxID=6832 RepID=A0A553P6D9_TIGCA|nr:MORN repeat-containing protein 3-like [Tigriopus californicus]TRY73242.1 hypothetical protein TCAL_02568 [Tigriopus californicus]
MKIVAIFPRSNPLERQILTPPHRWRSHVGRTAMSMFSSGLGKIHRSRVMEPTNPNTIHISLYRADNHRELTYRGECSKPLFSSCSSSWSNSQPHGWGTRYYRNGSIYEGQWLDGIREGYGQLRVRHKACATALPHPDDEPLYAGQWQRNKRHGYGVQFYSRQEWYEGLWHLGHRHGWGRMRYKNGDEYEGGWQHGKRDGAGLCLYSNGDQFEGVWRNDVKQGTGKYLFHQSKRLLQGVWHEDVFKSGLLSGK